MDKHTRWKLRLALAALCSVMLTASAHGAEEFPKTAAEAMALYEGDTDDWARGPVQYILIGDERKAWDKLETSEARRRFISWFWQRRDPEPRDNRNPFMEDFYARVAVANDRFGGMPRGWLSDRGHAWIMLDKPHSIRQRPSPSGGELTTWIYHVPGISMALTSVPNELHVTFVQSNRNWEAIGDYGNVGIFPTVLFEIFEQVNKAAIESPELKAPGR